MQTKTALNKFLEMFFYKKDQGSSRSGRIFVTKHVVLIRAQIIISPKKQNFKKGSVLHCRLN